MSEYPVNKIGEVVNLIFPKSTTNIIRFEDYIDRFGLQKTNINDLHYINAASISTNMAEKLLSLIEKSYTFLKNEFDPLFLHKITVVFVERTPKLGIAFDNDIQPIIWETERDFIDNIWGFGQLISEYLIINVFGTHVPQWFLAGFSQAVINRLYKHLQIDEKLGKIDPTLELRDYSYDKILDWNRHQLILKDPNEEILEGVLEKVRNFVHEQRVTERERGLYAASLRFVEKFAPEDVKIGVVLQSLSNKASRFWFEELQK